MFNLILGNFIALIASILMIYVGTIKDKSKIIFTQTLQIMITIVSNIILGGITGAVINIICCIRNILCYKEKLNKTVQTILIILSIIFSLIFNDLGLIGLLPLISTVIYTIFMNIQDVVKFKVLIMVTTFMWFIYDLTILSYSSALFDLLCVFTNLFSILRIKQLENKTKNTSN